MTKEEIGRIIKESRNAAGLTQLQVSEALGRPQNTISAWEMGRAQPDANTLFELFQVLGRSVDEAFGFTKNAPPLSGEALKMARDYDRLDAHGQKVVRVITDEELVRCQEEQNILERLGPPKVLKLPKARKHGGLVEIKVYDLPAAAGLGNELGEPDFHLEQYPDFVLPHGTDFGIRIDGDSMEPKLHDGYTAFVQTTRELDSGEIGLFVLNCKSYIKRLTVDRERREMRLVSLNRTYEPIVISEFDDFRILGRVLGQYKGSD